MNNYKMGFIYKITNTVSNKCYIGETKQESPELRWREHIKSNNKSNGCPALKGAINKYGLDKFKFEVLIICFDEDRYKYEIDYIKKYNSQVPNGYNILPGGEGGGFLGKKHTEESIKKIIDGGERFREANPNHYDTYRERHQLTMQKVNISSVVKKSENFKKAVIEGRVGGRSHKDGKQSDETKKKIKESVTKYYQKNEDMRQINIEKHREAMTKANGKKISQFNLSNEFVKEYNSIADAGRISGVKKSNIQQVLLSKTKTAGGFIWKYIDKTDLKT
jgi:group I intron endonuclease